MVTSLTNITCRYFSQTESSTFSLLLLIEDSYFRITSGQNRSAPSRGNTHNHCHGGRKNHSGGKYRMRMVTKTNISIEVKTNTSITETCTIPMVDRAWGRFRFLATPLSDWSWWWRQLVSTIWGSFEGRQRTADTGGLAFSMVHWYVLLRDTSKSNVMKIAILSCGSQVRYRYKWFAHMTRLFGALVPRLILLFHQSFMVPSTACGQQNHAPSLRMDSTRPGGRSNVVVLFRLLCSLWLDLANNSTTSTLSFM